MIGNSVLEKDEDRTCTASDGPVFQYACQWCHKRLGEVSDIHVRSSVDDRDVQGWVVRPPDFDPSRKYPLILEIHGGPFANYGPRFPAEMQLYAAAGYVVLYVNPRGSTRYGEEFGNLIHHTWRVLHWLMWAM